MTETNEAIEVDTPEVVESVNDTETQEVETEEVERTEAEETEGETEGEVEFPKKAVNALSRKNKTINKLRAQMQELEAKLNATPQADEAKPINPDDFDQYGDYIEAKIEALAEQKIKQSQGDMQQQQLQAQKDQLNAQRDQYIIEQAQEAAQVLTDLPQVWQQNAQTLDTLPQEITDIFYGIDNAPAAIYTLAKEGKLESLRYANPAVAAYEIVNAQNRGMELMSKPQTRVSNAPQPIEKAKASGSIKKQLHQLKGDEILNWVKS